MSASMAVVWVEAADGSVILVDSRGPSVPLVLTEDTARSWINAVAGGVFSIDPEVYRANLDFFIEQEWVER